MFFNDMSLDPKSTCVLIAAFMKQCSAAKLAFALFVPKNIKFSIIKDEENTQPHVRNVCKQLTHDQLLQINFLPVEFFN